MSNTQAKFQATASVIWQLNRQGSTQYLVTVESLYMKNTPYPGNFLAALLLEIVDGREVPTPDNRWKATPLKVYGEVTVKKVRRW